MFRNHCCPGKIKTWVMRETNENRTVDIQQDGVMG